MIETLVFLLSWRCLLCHKHDSSEILWSYFHLGSLEGVMITLPVFPVHSISIRGVTATKIQAIEIWVVTLIVPPSSFELNGAVVMLIIITILISSGEWHTAMESKRVARISWKSEQQYEYYVWPTMSRSYGRTKLEMSDKYNLTIIIWMKSILSNDSCQRF